MLSEECRVEPSQSLGISRERTPAVRRMKHEFRVLDLKSQRFVLTSSDPA